MFNITEVSPVEIEYLKLQLTEHGANITPLSEDNGISNFEIGGHGIVAHAAYEEAQHELTVNIIRKPFFVSEEHIKDGIVSAINNMPDPNNKGTN
jgi:hypothetical protein